MELYWESRTHWAAKNAIHGNLRSWVSTKTFCTKTFGEQLCCNHDNKQVNKHPTSKITTSGVKVVITKKTFKLFLSILTPWPPGRLLTALSIFPRSAFDVFYLQMSLSHGYLLRIRINQVREVSIVYCQWIVIAYGIPFHWKFFCKSGFKFSLWDFCHLSFKNGGLLGWLESRNCTKKTICRI